MVKLEYVVVASAIAVAVLAVVAIIRLPGEVARVTPARQASPGDLEVSNVEVCYIHLPEGIAGTPENALIDVVFPLIQNLSDDTISLDDLYALVELGGRMQVAREGGRIEPVHEL